MPDLEHRLRQEFALVRQRLQVSAPDVNAVFSPRRRHFSLRLFLGGLLVAAGIGTPVVLVNALSGHAPKHHHLSATPTTVAVSSVPAPSPPATSQILGPPGGSVPLGFSP